MMALAPPLDQTPTLPSMVLVGTFVTVDDPKTVKLANDVPSKGVADAMPEQSTPMASVSVERSRFGR